MNFSQVKDKKKLIQTQNMAKKPVKSNKVVQALNLKTVEKTNSKSSNFLKFLKKYQTVIISFALVLVLLVGGSLAYLRISNDQRDNASAGLNCDTANGFTPSGSTCVKTETVNKICADNSAPVNGKCSIVQNTVTGYFCPTDYNSATQPNYLNTGKLFGGTIDGSNNCNASMTTPVFGQSSTNVPVLIIDCSSPRYEIPGFDFPCYQEDAGAVIYGFGGSNYCGIFQSGTINPVPPYANYIIESGGYRICASGTVPNGNTLFGVLLSRVYGGFSYSASQIITPTTVLVDATCPSGGYTNDGVNSNTCSKTLTQTTGVTYTPENGDVTAITCDKVTYTENTNANCTITVKGAPAGVPYSGTVNLSINKSGGTANCVLSGTSTTQNCNPVNVGPATGGADTSKTVTTNLGGSLGITVTPAITEITNSDISSITCTTPVASGGTITCTANFTANKSGTVSFTSSPDIDASSTATGCTTGAIAATDTSKSCTFTAKTVDSDTVSTVTGNASGGGSNPKTTQVTVTTNLITITNDNLADALEDCTDKTVASNGTYNCTFALEAGYKFPATGDFKAATSTTDNGTTAQATISPNCTYTANATTGNLTCNGIPAPTNNTTGNLDREILLRLGTTGNYTDKGDVTITAGLSEIIFIPQSALTETPNPTTGLKVFGTTDYTLVLKDDRLVEGGKTATCDFRMKEVTAVDGATDTVNVALGYNNVTATTQSIVALNNGGSLTTDAQKYFRVNYNSTTTNTGVSIKFPLAKQIRTDYNIQIRCKRSDNQEFARDQKVNFKFGAYSLVTVGAEQV
jgi:hypothetical protein